MRGGAIPLEVGPFIHPLSPLDIGLADQFLEKISGTQDSFAVAFECNEGLIEVREEKLASSQMAVQEGLQRAFRIHNVTSAPGPYRRLRLRDRGHRGGALHRARSGHSSDSFRRTILARKTDFLLERFVRGARSFLVQVVHGVCFQSPAGVPRDGDPPARLRERIPGSYRGRSQSLVAVCRCFGD